MEKYLNPKSDLTFKRIFGEHPEILMSFLNAVMPFEPDRFIEAVYYLPPEQVPENPGKKNSIVDVKCIDNYKRQFIVEMQVCWTELFYNRIVFNAGKAYVRQLKQGESYHLLQPVYTLAILNENFDHKTKRFYHHFQIVNKENTDEIIPGLEFILVELTDKFRPETLKDRKMMALWLRFLDEVGEEMTKLPKEMQENEFISQAVELCKVGAYTEAQLASYEHYWDIVRTEKTLKVGSHQEGRAEGESIGLEKGRAEGESIGLEKGRAEGEVKALERVVVESKRNGFSIEQIQLITKLTIEQITEILKRNNML